MRVSSRTRLCSLLCLPLEAGHLFQRPVESGDASWVKLQSVGHQRMSYLVCAKSYISTLQQYTGQKHQL